MKIEFKHKTNVVKGPAILCAWRMLWEKEKVGWLRWLRPSPYWFQKWFLCVWSTVNVIHHTRTESEIYFKQGQQNRFSQMPCGIAGSFQTGGQTLEMNGTFYIWTWALNEVSGMVSQRSGVTNEKTNRVMYPLLSGKKNKIKIKKWQCHTWPTERSHFPPGGF